MEHDSEAAPKQPEGPPQDERKGCGSAILKLVIGAIVIFIAAVAFVFGACLLG